jgi:hypothetical protein
MTDRWRVVRLLFAYAATLAPSAPPKGRAMLHNAALW